MIVAGSAMKKTCICGISLDSTASPRLKITPKTRKGAEIWIAIVKPPRDRPVIEHRRVADRRDAAGRQKAVAIEHGRDDEVVEVGGEDQRHAEQGQEVADRRLLAHGRVDGGDEAEPELVGDDGAGRLQPAHHHADATPMMRPTASSPARSCDAR